MEQNQLVTVAQQSGLEPAKAELYAASFAPYMNEVVNLMQEAKRVNRVNPTAQDSAQARKIRLALVPQRTGAEKEKDKQKAALLKETNLIQALYNTVKSTAEMTEAEMLEIEKHQERIEAERKSRLKAEREESLSPYCDPSLFPLADMAEDAFQQLLSGQKLAHEARLEAERKAQEARIEAENKRIKHEERERNVRHLGAFFDWSSSNVDLSDDDFAALEKEAIQKKEVYESAEKEREKENERLRKEAEKKEEERKQAEAKAKKERDDLEAKLQKQREEAEKARKDAEAKQAEIDRKEREQKEAAERAERERIAAEKKAAAAPDKEKLQAFKLELQRLKVPELKTKEAAQIAENIQTLLDKVANYIDEKCASI